MRLSTWVSNIRNLAILYVGIFMLATCVVGGFVYLAYYNNSYVETKAALEADIQGFSDVYTFSGKQISVVEKVIEKRLEKDRNSSFYLLLNADGGYVTGNIHTLPQVAESRSGDYVVYEVPYENVIGNAPSKHDFFTDHYDILTKRLAFENQMVLLVGRDIDAFQTSQDFVVSLAWIAIGLVCIMAFIGFTMGAVLLKRVKIIYQTANKVVEKGDLSARIPVEKDMGDFKPLADIFNAMLTRIEGSVEGIRQVSDNIAHDLRTPLTRLKQYVEDMKEQSDNPRMLDIANETDRIIVTFNALLRIANLEHGKSSSEFCHIDLKVVLNDLYEYYNLLSEEKKIMMEIELPEEQLHVIGDKDLLFQAFSNIVENAMKFTPEGGEILLQVKNDDTKIDVTISDSGMGIADEEKEKIFRRFYRIEESRHTQGNGLGLPLVKAILDLHNAHIFLDNNHPKGLRFKVSFSKH